MPSAEPSAEPSSSPSHSPSNPPSPPPPDSGLAAFATSGLGGFGALTTAANGPTGNTGSATGFPQLGGSGFGALLGSNNGSSGNPIVPPSTATGGAGILAFPNNGFGAFSNAVGLVSPNTGGSSGGFLNVPFPSSASFGNDVSSSLFGGGGIGNNGDNEEPDVAGGSGSLQSTPVASTSGTGSCTLRGNGDRCFSGTNCCSGVCKGLSFFNSKCVGP